MVTKELYIWFWKCKDCAARGKLEFERPYWPQMSELLRAAVEDHKEMPTYKDGYCNINAIAIAGEEKYLDKYEFPLTQLVIVNR